MSDEGVWDRWVGRQLEGVRLAGQWRDLRPLDGHGPQFRLPDGRLVVSFASNDYLGLSAHPAVVEASGSAASRWGSGSGSSRLIVGDRPVHHDLERRLAAWKGADAALVFPTGYQANLAVLTTFASGQECRVVSDELNHASIIDGGRLARAEVRVYRHGDVDHAADLIRTAPGRVMVVSDSVFSMDGDSAPIVHLSRICARTGALLVLDDAHAVFPLPEPDPGAMCIRVGTLSKALGSQGGFVTGPRPFVELMVNRGRSFIFTTGLTPPAAAAALAALEIVDSTEGCALVERLRSLVDRVAPAHPSPIVPVVIGSEAEALDAAAQLLTAGFLVPAIRPPTVAPGTSRLRVSLSSAHREVDVAGLVDALRSLGPRAGPPAVTRSGSGASAQPGRPPSGTVPTSRQ